ncbi:hypothetical protein E1A91_D09G280300v1 [Gossypium mustelinum]|uniref:Methionyl/Valyl/Leucyl/Isoleucyl-tRNA synthetase anticodon-binding domain-containing protein n=2 Tax=Gossypium TaxID=3633 RepID=A0A5J5Q9Y7_GOSBA|nr:hypothetical protein ES319_D09G272100v1 [Gossypium barbadense]KAB2015074.1 hypothetical protein ES319_D09G272100v1 [Gossypium barbadense]TYI67180.1 hypothetical protein E1A91_D09G280300v1 [Gossypium mustelinum]
MLIDAVTESYNKYFFGDGGREVYDFGGDFADWYIEASKAHIYQSGDDSVALVAQTVLLYVCIDIIIYQSKQSKRESRWVLRIVKNGWSCFIGG